MGGGDGLNGQGGIKEDTCWDEHWVLYVGDEPLESTSEIIIVLDAN